MATTSKVTLGDRLRALEAGIKANFTDVQNVIVGGTTYTVPQLEAQIEAYLAAQTLTVTTGNAYHAAVAAEKTSNAAATVFRSGVEAYAVSRYGKTSPILSQLGFTPAKAKKTTAAVKAVAVLKVKATRKARNTMGKKEKLKIKGTIDPAIAATLATGSAEPATGAGAETVGTSETIGAEATVAPAHPQGEGAGVAAPAAAAGHSG